VGDSAETIALLWQQLNPTAALEHEPQAHRVRQLWSGLKPGALLVMNKLFTGGFRVGVAQGLVIRALAQLSDLEEPLLAHRLMGGFQPSPEAYRKLIAPAAAAHGYQQAELRCPVERRPVGIGGRGPQGPVAAIGGGHHPLAGDRRSQSHLPAAAPRLDRGLSGVAPIGALGKSAPIGALNKAAPSRGAINCSKVGQDGAMSTQTELGWASCTAVERDPQRVSGAWVFRGTRIPVAALFENLEDGISLAEFVELFPGVTQEQARSVLEHAARSTAAAVA
jgi:uncharacterized protein (DUF433 family)